SEERQFVDGSEANKVWEAIKLRHGGSGPIQQVDLLKVTLNTRTPYSSEATKTLDGIFERIDRVFDAGAVMRDLL
ncbi:hypothetical protein DXG01_001493, partial [Tephrocybe rancida]